MALLTLLGAGLDLPVTPHDERRPPAALPVPPRGESPPLAPRRPVFFGVELPTSSRIAYVLDFSSSMTPSRWSRLREECERSWASLDPSTEFWASTYDCSSYPWRRMWSPSADWPIAVVWLQSRPNPWERGTGTGTAQAVVAALSWKPTLIVLLTDGSPGACGLVPPGHDPAPAHLRLVREQNVQPVPIWTFCLQGDQPAQRFCQQLATESGGSYVDVR